jgi:TrmH family RNA methyltransferase
MRLPPPITSRTNARVKALRAAFSGKASRPGELLGVEGSTLIGVLHKEGHSFETVYLREGSESSLDPGWSSGLRTAHWAVLSREVFDSAVNTASPQGIAATWIIRAPEPSAPESGNVLVLEDLQDPGNVGTLIRSAMSFGFGQVCVTPATASQWNPKVVRASAGAVFRMPVVREPLDRIASRLRAAGVRIFAAVASFSIGPEHGTPVMAAPHGVLTGRIANAVAPATDRYNNRLKDIYDAEPTDGYAASHSYDTDFVEPCAIMIGNEGAGLSAAARSLADEQVSIPHNYESLNAAVAGSILMYEVTRQITLRLWARRQGLRP